MPLGLGQNQYRRRPVTTVIILAGVALQVVFVLAHGANKELLGDGVFLALDQDASLPSWSTIVLFAFAGTASGLLAWLRPAWRWPLVVLAVLTLLLSLEQTVQIHGRAEREEIGGAAGPLVEVIGGVGVLGALALAARAMPPPYRWLLLGAIATIGTAAFSSMVNDSFDLPYAGVIFFQTLEEVSEMLTATLILAATAEPLLGAIGQRLGVPAG